MNDISIIAFGGVLVAALCGATYKLGKKESEKNETEKRANTLAEAKKIRDRLNDATFVNKLRNKFKR